MAKFKKGDEVEYKGRHYLVHRVNGEEAEISDWVGHDLTVGVNDPALKLIAHNSVRSRNAVVAKAINAQRAARNAAYPKAIDKDLGNFTGRVMPAYNLFSLEYGDVHSTKPEDQYVGIEGTVAEVKAKAQRTFKGKNLTDAMALCAWASAEMEKYAKSERAHGRRHTNACGTQK